MREASDPGAVSGDGVGTGGAGLEDRGDWSVLSVLLAPSEHPRLWSVGEIARVLQDNVGAADAVARLLRDGLVHRQGDFVFPTRAAVRFYEIAE